MLINFNLLGELQRQKEFEVAMFMYRTGEQQNEYNAMNLTKTHGESARRIFALITSLTSSVLHSIFSLFFFLFFFCDACVPILRKAVVRELNGETWIQLQQPSS